MSEPHTVDGVEKTVPEMTAKELKAAIEERDRALREAQEADQKTIAEHCEIEQATAGSILMRMEEAELIHRRQRKGNRRSLYVSLTEKGMQAAENMQAVFDKTDELAASALTAEELEQLKQSLKKISLVLSDNNYERKTAK